MPREGCRRAESIPAGRSWQLVVIAHLSSALARKSFPRVNRSQFPENLLRGTQAALEISGKHGRPNVKVESDPAAVTSLSAACRCASRPPSNPIVTPSEIEPSQQ